jgi:hypothetical protein
MVIAPRLLHGAAVAAALAAVSIFAVPSAEARCAERLYLGEANGLFQATTGIAARSAWRREVREHLGGDFAYWSRARNRVTSCSRRDGGRWHCRARARPCNS